MFTSPEINQKLQIKRPRDAEEFFLTTLKDIHLHTGEWAEVPGLRAKKVYSFAAIALLVLIIAIINYANMATALFKLRFKRAGHSKDTGGKKSAPHPAVSG